MSRAAFVYACVAVSEEKLSIAELMLLFACLLPWLVWPWLWAGLILIN